MALIRFRKTVVVSISVAVSFLIFIYRNNASKNRTISFSNKVTSNVAGTQCVTGKPCVYDDEVDFRIIVITYNRSESLMKLLRTIDELELDGDNGALEIWIDVSKEGQFHSETVQTAKSFQWKHGSTRVHVQNSHAGIRGQWIDTWRPKSFKSKELALILEDDLSISKYSYRWIKAVNKYYGSYPDFAGSTLTSDEQRSHDGFGRVLSRPANETVFMYKCIGTWGFSPRTSTWGDFQDWYHEHIKKKDFHPYVPITVTTKWYKGLEKKGRADSMWTQWFIYYTFMQRSYTVYSNLQVVNGNGTSCLSVNRREVGLHYYSKGREDYCSLLDRWDESFVSFPNPTVRLDWGGNVTDEY